MPRKPTRWPLAPTHGPAGVNDPVSQPKRRRYQRPLPPLSVRYWHVGAELARIEGRLSPALRDRVERELALFAQAVDDAGAGVSAFKLANRRPPSRVRADVPPLSIA